MERVAFLRMVNTSATVRSGDLVGEICQYHFMASRHRNLKMGGAIVTSGADNFIIFLV